LPQTTTGADRANGLQALGYQAEGWDPVHRPEVGKRDADVVNLGYVVNVIEDPGEIELACEGLELGWQDEQAL
jgi:hypothetical protein